MKKICLYPHFFSERERPIYESENFSAYLFRYDSGVEAVKLCNSLGHIVVLPYDGQMIWDAVFYGQSIKMRTNYTQPKRVAEFFDIDGCYLMHCGPRRICDMNHKFGLVHGELPLARYDSAWLSLGEDECGSFIAISGEYIYNRHRSDQYIARPMAKLYAGSSVLEVSMEITNTSGYPMDYMYLFHTNSPARTNGRFVQPLGWTHKDMDVFVPTSEEGLCPDTLEAYRAFLQDPESSRMLTSDKLYEPEFCIHLNNPKSDDEGFIRFMQVDESGYADYTAVPADGPLRFFARWITRTKDHSACSLCQPSSCGTLGYEGEKAAGRVISLRSGESITAQIYMGLLDPKSAKEMEAQINSCSG